MLPRHCNHQMERIKALFEKELELSPRDISERCHMAKRNAYKYINILHSAEDIHICSYLRHNVPVYRYGPGEDMKKPSKKKNDRERANNYRNRVLANNKYQEVTKIKSITSYLTLGT